jgi:hypothetical protein
MIEVSRTVMVVAGAVMALWLAAAVYVLAAGLRLRRRGHHLREQADRLAALLQSAPAIPMLVRADGKLEAPSRLAAWLGLAALPGYLSELTAEGGPLEGADRAGFADDIASVQRGAKSFSPRAQCARVEPDAAGQGNTGRTGSRQPRRCDPLAVRCDRKPVAYWAMLEPMSACLRDALEALAGLIEAAPLAHVASWAGFAA